MNKPIILNKIRKLRFQNHEMTQQELADKTGVTRQTIHSIENGKYFPTLELAFRISREFGLSIEDVFIWNGEED